MSELNYTKSERKQIIHDLQNLAAEVIELKKTSRHKKPIVIEFSGSPKSGKTSCINSLEVFLKRNGFKVEIIHELARECPVSEKDNPMFNIWTSCMSIAGMIGVLDKDSPNCDVLILDRGIFDACCWFHWLSANSHLGLKQKQIIEKFLMMDSFINRVNIIFAFYADPKTSIEREYATLLTDKPGNIMNETVLSEYLTSIKATISSKKIFCHSIFEIDTSKKNQDEVGKEVTDITLKTLRDLLMERIGYFEIESNEINNILKKKRVFEYHELQHTLINIKFDLREKVESNLRFLQPIPIAVITNKNHDKVLVVKKNSKSVTNDSPEKDSLLIYVGGHPREENFTVSNMDDFLSICRTTLNREVQEEIGISLAFDDITPFLIYTPDLEISKRHLGICFPIVRDLDTLKIRLDPEELVLHKGTSKSGKFISISEFENSSENLESWSIEILKHYFKCTIKEQIPLP
jgi:predicted NUDIX family phosphoesterase/predicted ATPase